MRNCRVKSERDILEDLRRSYNVFRKAFYEVFMRGNGVREYPHGTAILSVKVLLELVLSDTLRKVQQQG